MALLIVTMLPLQAGAQGNMVQIKVEKRQKTTKGHADEGESKSFSLYTETLFYNVEISNTSSISFPEITIKWFFLYDPTGRMRLEVHPGGSSSTSWAGTGTQTAKGKVTTSLAAGKKYEFDTDSVELGSLITNSIDPRARDAHHGKAIGYLIEVYTEDKLIGSKALPSDIKRRLKEE